MAVSIRQIHPVFVGDRSDEAAARLAGQPYASGGILRTVAATRAASDDLLEALVEERFQAALDGGTTTLTNACLACRRHHRLLHNNSGWQARLGPDGHPEFLPPATLDPERRPQRNTFHRRQ